jgi:hypothetical protein
MRELIALAILTAIIAYAVAIAPPHQVPSVTPIDSPRCFPEGTEGVDGFPLCSDNFHFRQIRT